MDGQVWRYQLPNPLNEIKATRGISVFPHVALIEMLLECDGFITNEEYVLFAARTKKFSDVEKNVARVKAWRRLTKATQGEIISRLQRTRYRTIKQNSGFGLAFHRCDLLLERSHNKLSVTRANAPALKRILEQHKNESVPIEFKNEPDAIASYGDPEEQPFQLKALDYYVDISDVEKAVAVFEKLPPQLRGGVTAEEFERSQFLERDLENYLEKHLDEIETGLKKVGRQYSTTVGPIDLLTRAKNGDLVVIELKKGRAADKVFGQICRYMGCMKSEYEGRREVVRGIIVAREIDEKLTFAARAVPPGLVRLATFEQGDSEDGKTWINVTSATR